MLAKVLAAAAVMASPAVFATPAGPPHPAAHYDEVPKPYAYEYGVSDSYSGANFNQHENADGKIVSGSYQVLLPDGRTQVSEPTFHFQFGIIRAYLKFT